MKKSILLLILILSPLFSFSTKVTGAYAIGIFDASGNGENVQHVRKTKADYNDICYTKIFLVGNSFNVKPKVSIGKSKGIYQSTKSIYGKSRKLKIGEVMLFKHYKVTNGYIKVSFKNKLFDSKVYVK